MNLVLLYFAISFIVPFLLGSIPWGVIISKLVYRKDLRDEGSGNIGTTNAMRSLGKVGGTVVFLLDFGKGVLAGCVGFLCAWCGIWQTIDPDVIQLTTSNFVIDFLIGDVASVCLALSFAGCVLGHIFCPWLGWKGGKGIAVAAACLLVVYGPVGFFIEIGVFAVLVIVTRYVSVGSIAAAALCPFLALYYYGVLQGQWCAWLIISVAAMVVIWAHRENIARLRAGTERRIGKKTCA